ncbi:MAG TPA: hypothetical protein VEJ63_16655 [Planctomycetota bacterium]|nr:hypothetical protein [Planctomycetota bacterium]
MPGVFGGIEPPTCINIVEDEAFSESCRTAGRLTGVGAGFAADLGATRTPAAGVLLGAGLDAGRKGMGVGVPVLGR